MKPAILFTAIIFIGTMTACAQNPPAEVKTYLDKNYPDWTTDRYDEACPETKRLHVSGDFNGDKKTDHAVKFFQGDTGYIVALVSGETGYQAYVLESGEKVRSLALVLGEKGKKYPRFGDDPEADFIKLSNDAPYTFLCETDVIRYYIYENGKFN